MIAETWRPRGIRRVDAFVFSGDFTNAPKCRP
jgi:hypothetical protein